MFDILLLNLSYYAMIYVRKIIIHIAVLVCNINYPMVWTVKNTNRRY